MVTALCLMIMSAIFFGDLWIKNRIEKDSSLGDGEKIGNERALLGGKILIRKHHNKGAMLNVGEKKRSVVAGVSVVMTLVLLPIFILSLGHRGNVPLRLGLALLLGGAFSNTYDRLKRKYVVDYISFGVKWNGLRKVVFNISDFCIIIGAAISALAASK